MESMVGNSMFVKQLNINLVRAAILRKRIATKLELAEMTRLTTVTIGTILNELLAAGEIREGDLIPSQGGRPSRQYLVNENYSKVCVVSAGATKGEPTISLRVLNLFQETLYTESIQIAQPLIFDFFLLLDKAFANIPDIKAIGFALPGVVYQDKMTSNYHHLNGSGFLETFKQRYAVPVIFENVINAACFGYSTADSDQIPQSVLYIHLSENELPRSSFFHDGKIMHGAKAFAGEITQHTFDIPWKDEKFYQDEKKFAPKIAGFLSGLSAALSPEKIVLSGSRFNENSTLQIAAEFTKRSHPEAKPAVIWSDSYPADLEAGIGRLTLNSLLQPEIR